jgi:hypothetical protein
MRSDVKMDEKKELPPLHDRMASAAQDSRKERPAQKLFVVSPVDPQLPPFHFSNTPNRMLIAAPDEEYARRLARMEAGHDAYADVALVDVDEWMPTGPMVITRDFKG